MNSTPTLSAAALLALVIDGLCRAVAARIKAPGMTGPFIVLIWRRLRRIDAQVQALVAAIRAGRVRGGWTVAGRAARGPVARPALVLPRRFGWLLPLVPDVAAYGGQLRVALADPEMAAMIAASPRLARALRPLCRALAIDLSTVALEVPPAPEAPVAAPAARDEVAAKPLTMLCIGASAMLQAVWVDADGQVGFFASG